MYLPEEAGLSAYRAWLTALHFPEEDARLSYGVIKAGEIYSDECIRVFAIPTRHILGGTYPSFAFLIEGEGKRMIYTGDLAPDFSDYPREAVTEEIDLILSELVHFDPEKNLDRIAESKTKRLIFTHLSPRKAEYIKTVLPRFPFPVSIAEDNQAHEI